jgi:hypothetical protein
LAVAALHAVLLSSLPRNAARPDDIRYAHRANEELKTMAIAEPHRQSIAPAEQQLHRLDAKSAAAISTLHEGLQNLLRCEPFTFSTKPQRLPVSAVYLFTEESTPLYVGRTDHFGQRLGNHCRPSSGANQSVFAFKLAREAAGLTEAMYTGPNTRARLMKNPAFIGGFKAAKQRLNAMQIRFVEEQDQIRQALLEIYCAVALGTRYNDFSTH